MNRSVHTSPIIFSTSMIRALLDGSKSQTRRLITSQWANVKRRHEAGERVLLWVRETWADVNTENGPAFLFKAGGLHFCVDDAYPVEYERYPGMQFTMWCGDLQRGAPGHSWRSPLHMPRWASRLTLELTDVRIQQLQDISEKDAVAEGVEHNGPCDHTRRSCEEIGCFGPDSYRGGYYDLWNLLHGEGSWDANPEIIAFSFRVHRQNVDAVTCQGASS